MTTNVQPNGPSRLRLLLRLANIRKDPLGNLVGAAREYGDVVFLPLRYPTYLLFDPADIKYVLVSEPRKFNKAGALTVGKQLLGQGLVSSEEPLHTCQRRIMQPMFHKRSITGFGKIMTDTTAELTADWQDGSTIDIARQMTRVTLSIVGKTLFSIDLSRDALELGQAFVTCQRMITLKQLGFPMFDFLPFGPGRTYRNALKQVNDMIFEIIESRRRNGGDHQDLLAMLMSVGHEDGSSMSDQQLRDEVVTIIMAGHETTGSALSWTLYLLSKHPEVAEKLRAELDQVLAGRHPTVEDMPNLVYANMVWAESLRVYPPAWILARRTIEEVRLPSGVTVPKGGEVMMIQYVSNRNPRYFPDPERFDPERFAPGKEKEIPPYVYFPFGSGPRSCIGEPFARMEGILLMAMIFQEFDLELDPNQIIEPEPLITLRPKYGVKMKVQRRQ